MTRLTKPVKREVEVHRMRPVVIEIDPTRQAIGFREKGTRKTYYLPILTAFRMAVLTAKDKKEK